MARAISKAQEKIAFNESYLSVLDAILTEKYSKRLKKRSYASKRRLLPLEIKATDPSVLNQYKQDKAVEKLKEEQRLPRLAAEQTYLRACKKKGERAAKAEYAARLSAFDSKLEKTRAELSKRYPTNLPQKADPEAVKRYEQATLDEKSKLNHFESLAKRKKAEVMERQTKRLTAQNAKLQARIDRASLEKKQGSGTHSVKGESDCILQINDLLMQFGGLTAVDHLSFSVKSGEIFGLIGPNGAGKTTVFNCITRFYKPTGGTIYYRDRSEEMINLASKKVHDVIKTGIARTFQNVELIWELSVLDNMLIGAHSLYHSGFFGQLLHSRKLRQEEAVMRAQALQVLERLSLLPYKDMIPLGLPYGILKKIELARTLMTNPRLIILDEPAAGLNEAETDELKSVIRAIRDDYKCSIFLVEHDMGLVMDICDTVCAISFGKMLAIGTPQQIQDDPAVQEAYLGGE